MSKLIAREGSKPWRRRLYLPAYNIAEAARYSRTNPQTVSYWHRARTPALPKREPREPLSYMQLIEVAVVAAMREHVPLKVIREARNYAAKILNVEYPFASLKFKTDGQDLILKLDDVEPLAGSDKLIVANQGGQTAWTEIIGSRLTEFEYEDDLATRWKVGGAGSPIVIDPRVSFGAPAISGVPTWALKGRWEAGETAEDIADDFGLSLVDVELALRFEKCETEAAATH